MSDHDDHAKTTTTCGGVDVDIIPSKCQVWKLACRPHTLTASVVPVLVGCGCAMRMMRDHLDDDHNRRLLDAPPPPSLDGSYPSSVLRIASFQFGIFACLIQLTTNLHNDYADFVKGADTAHRIGQARATQRGWLTPRETCMGCILCLFAALCVGANLILVPTTTTTTRGGGGDDDGIAAFVNCDASYHGNNGDIDDFVNGNGPRGHFDTHDGPSIADYYYGIRELRSYCDRIDPLMTFVVLSSMFNAVAYTGGPFPLGYVGLGNVSIGYSGFGDVFVFLYFGIVATMGVPYLCLVRSFPGGIAAVVASSSSSSSSSSCRPFSYRALETIAKTMTTTTTTTGGGGARGIPTLLLWNMLRPSLLHSLPVGFLATAIIVVNNLRDRHTDVHAGKRTLAVRYGEAFARAEYLALVLGSYAFCVVFYCCDQRRGGWSSSTMTTGIGPTMTTAAWTSLLPLLSFPAAMPQLRAVAFGGKDGAALNDHVGGTARLQMMYCVLMAIGLVISSR